MFFQTVDLLNLLYQNELFMKTAVVIGAGIGGIAAALRLSKKRISSDRF